MEKVYRETTESQNPKGRGAVDALFRVLRQVLQWLKVLGPDNVVEGQQFELVEWTRTSCEDAT